MFLELQNRLVQTRKARKGTKNRRDYYEEEENNFDFDNAVYRKALYIANKIVQHYDDLGELPLKDNISITFGSKSKPQNDKILEKENEALKIENQKLQAKIKKLEQSMEEMRDKFRHGGRKGYDEVMIKKIKAARESGETWRGLSARLNISTTTAQKLYKIN